METPSQALSAGAHWSSEGAVMATGTKLFGQQFGALIRKNVRLSLRSKRATALQLASSLFFVFLVFVCDKAVNSRFDYITDFENVFDPEYHTVSSIPPCKDAFFLKEEDCYDFIWSGNGSSTFRSIVDRIRENNPGRPIPASKVLGFETSDGVDDWLLQNRLRCPGALHFMERGDGVIRYGLQTNMTAKRRRGYYEDSVVKFQVPMQVAAEREIARFLTADPNLEWNVGLKEFAHPVVLSSSAVSDFGPTFFLAAAMFGFVIQMGSIIGERELKLRQAMSTMGLYDSVYWLTWLTWEGLLTLISSILLVLFGMMFQFNFFLNNSFPILFLMFFLFQLNLVGLAFMLSAFISKSSSATNVGFFVYLLGFITQLVTAFGFPYDAGYSEGLRNVWSIFPPNLFAKGLGLLGQATATKEDKGISWSDRSDCPANEPDCVITMNDIFTWLFVTFLVWMFLAIYFDNVLPNVNGVRKSWFYFLKPSYWTGKESDQAEGGGCCSCTGSVPTLSESYPSDEDVAEEERKVRQQTTENATSANTAVQVRGLIKTFPGKRQFACCCKCKKTDPYHAVKGLWFNIEKDKLFCLLGPNGAGKTTSINCLTGITPITDGDALIYGHSVRSTVGMSNIRKFMGVCPQFDILWDSLSAKEHLHLFASIRGMPKAAIRQEAEHLLSQVKLQDAAHIRAGSYSGGMKRRLSVAIALIGDPKLVFLDEPTTGMDPVTRRHVWDIIEEAKKGRAIVLTTHSMEEADILGDRIAIMARGKLRCIGTSIHLKTRFGTGFVVNISIQRGEDGLKSEQLKLFFKENLDVEAKEENNAYTTFIIPREKEDRMLDFFTELEYNKNKLGITDIQVGLATLEEVFLNIAEKAEVETAAAEGRFETLVLPSGTSIQVPIGAKHVRIPDRENMMVEVYWSQDDTGALCIAGHSEEISVPSEMVMNESDMGVSRSMGSRRNRLSFNRLSSDDPVIASVVEMEKLPSMREHPR